MICPTHAGGQDQVGRGPGPPDLAGGIPAHGRAVGVRWSFMSLPAQTIL